MGARRSTSWTIAGLLAILTTGCPADREAVEGVDMSPDPRIEQAPATPTPPGEVPIGLEPHPEPPTDTVDLDTIPEPPPLPEGAQGAPGQP